MKFKHRKFRILVSTILYLGMLGCVVAWKDGSFDFDLGLFWILVAAFPFALYVLHGVAIFDKLIVDDAGLTVKRPFRKSLNIPFTAIRSLQLLKKETTRQQIKGSFVIRYLPKEKYEVPLDNLKLAAAFISKMEAGHRKAKQEN